MRSARWKNWLPTGASSKNFESEFILDLDAFRKRRTPRELKVPPVVQHLALAESFQARLAAGNVPTRAALARQYGLTRARVTQLLDLLKLDLLILDYVRTLPAGTPERLVTEKSLRRLVQMPMLSQILEATKFVPGFAAHQAGRRLAG